VEVEYLYTKQITTYRYSPFLSPSWCMMGNITFAYMSVPDSSSPKTLNRFGRILHANGGLYRTLSRNLVAIDNVPYCVSLARTNLHWPHSVLTFEEFI